MIGYEFTRVCIASYIKPTNSDKLLKLNMAIRICRKELTLQLIMTIVDKVDRQILLLDTL